MEFAPAGKDETSRETLVRAFEAHRDAEETATTEPEVKAEPEPEAKAEPEVKTEPEAKVEPEVKAEPKTKTEDAPKDEKIPSDGLRPPESWKPAIKDKHWKTLPAEVQAEVYRRERHVEQVLKDSAEAKRGFNAANELIGSFKDVFEYEKVPPLQTIQNLLTINRTLRFGNPSQRAQAMAQVIAGYEVDVGMLDEALSLTLRGAPERKEQNESQRIIQEAIAREMGPMREMMGSIQKSRQTTAQQEDAKIGKDIQEFADDTKNVYFEVVKEDMADLMELAAGRGQKLNLQDAYNRAILSHPDLAEKVTRERMEKTAAELSRAARKSVDKAAFSVSGAPSAGVAAGAGDGDVRSAIQAAISHHQGS